MRPSGRKLDEMRTVSIETGVMRHAEGSCLIKVGNTHVLCSATVEDRTPFERLAQNPAYRIRWQQARPRNPRKPTEDLVRVVIFEKQ